MNDENLEVKESTESKEAESLKAEEAKESEASRAADEVTETEEFNKEEKKTMTRTAKTISITAGAAVVVLVSYSVISSSGLINLNMDASINDVSYVDNFLYYDIDVEEVKSSNSVFFEIYRDEDAKTKLPLDLNNEETFTGNLKGYISIEELNIPEEFHLNGTLSYTVRLCGNTGLLDRTYDSKILEISGVESVFKGVSYQCDCANSGYFKFKMDFMDNLGQFSSFEATLSDSAGNVEKCEFTEDLHGEQKIYALNLESNAVFRISVNKNNEKDSSGNLIMTELFNENVIL